MKRWIAPALFSALLSFPVQAAPAKATVLPFAGPKANVARGQLVGILCEELDCVLPSNAGRGAKPDFNRARRNGVDLIVTGKVSGPARSPVLTLVSWGANGRVLSKDTFRLARNGKLSRTDLDEAKAKVLGAAGWTQPPVPDAPSSNPTLVPEAEVAAPPLAPSVEPEAHARASGPMLPLLWVEAGADFTHRSFAYSGLAAPNLLRAYETQPALFAPRIQAAVFPLARSIDGFASGLGIEAGYGFAVGLKSLDEDETPHPTTATRLDLGARLDLRPLAAFPLMVSPQLGYRSATFVVGAAADGSRLAGMPGLSYDALRAGLEIEVPFASVIAFGRAQYLHVLRLGELGEAPFFPKSSANGFEGTLGIGYRVIESVQVRLGFDYTRYGLTFESDPTATYVATGAADRYMGGTLSARYVY